VSWHGTNTCTTKCLGISIALMFAYMLMVAYIYMSQISDDMLLGAIAASLGIWITGVTIMICYLVIRN
jgi:hypothetical protein